MLKWRRHFLPHGLVNVLNHQGTPRKKCGASSLYASTADKLTPSTPARIQHAAGRSLMQSSQWKDRRDRKRVVGGWTLASLRANDSNLAGSQDCTCSTPRRPERVPVSSRSESFRLNNNGFCFTPPTSKCSSFSLAHILLILRGLI